MTSIETLYLHFLECTGVCTDTRAISAGGLFFALKGPNFNANAFAADALSKGSRYAVVDDPSFAVDQRYLLVPDGLTALQELGRHHRRQFNIPVIGITGTNGKTTTKELMHAVLSADRPTLATSGNLNNHIGVPLTLLRLRREHEVAIIEMGANKPGDIAELCAIAEPTHGSITNIGMAHLEGFGGFDGVVRTKSELYASIRSRGGRLFVNADDPLLMGKSEGIERVTYGRGPDADTAGDSFGGGPFLQVVFAGRDGLVRQVDTRLIGAYNLPNVLAAVAVAQHFKVPGDRIATALAAYEPSNNRSQFTDTGRNQVVMDAYNANPSSMRAALENFAAMTTALPKLAILGDMLELGDHSDAEHAAIIDLAQRLDIPTCFVGPRFSKAINGTPLSAFNDAAAALEALRAEMPKEKLILVKGSRGIKLETLLPAL
ncbi:MAG: UDP-N-acetylmuramoyl-tripeptide--D-alanyl-D-alanine ligase [Flavobacteriales bacterium]